MHRGRFRIGPAIVLGMVLVTAGCGDADERSPGSEGSGWSTAGCAMPRSPEHVTVSGVTMPVTPPALDALMNTIDQAGRGQFRASFAGLEVDQERVRTIVYRVPSAPFDDFIRKAAGDACVVVHDAPHSGADLDAWHDRVLADLPYWTHQGVAIVSVGAKHDGSGVEIGAQDPAQARTELVARYGAQAPLIFVASDPVRPLPAVTSQVAPPPGT
jgi:hypothetical protein